VKSASGSSFQTRVDCADRRPRSPDRCRMMLDALVPQCGKAKGPVFDLGLCGERVTGIEPAFSAWEFKPGAGDDRRRTGNRWSAATANGDERSRPAPHVGWKLDGGDGRARVSSRRSPRLRRRRGRAPHADAWPVWWKGAGGGRRCVAVPLGQGSLSRSLPPASKPQGRREALLSSENQRTAA
jgi:hypothetical protein